MTAGDWFLTAVGLPLLLLAGWVSSYRVWLRRADVGVGATALTGEAGGAGYHAFILPATLSFTSAWVGIIGMEVRDATRVSPPWLETVVDLSFLSCIILLAFGFWLWCFAWPRVFVPPHMREARSR
jgi:hypothetical protein